MSKLFSVLRLRETEFKNRIFVSPMCQYSSRDGMPNEWHPVHLFGHIHHSYGVTVYDGIQFVNASICDEGYRPTHEPVVIDLN